MSGDLLSPGLPGSRRPPKPASLPTVILPHVVVLPSRYYAPLALAEVTRDFAGLLTVEWERGEGCLRLRFTAAKDDPAWLIAEFLNRLLYATCAQGAEATR